MLTQDARPDEPFWIDAPGVTDGATVLPSDVSRWVALVVGIMRIAVHLIVLSAIALFALTYPWLWIGVVFYLLMIALIIASVRRGRQLGSRIRRIQERARSVTGAEFIGSAIHTAGHALLKVDQPVVLALAGAELAIYDFSSDKPLDSISVAQIEAVETVVYDEDRIPHTAVADQTAQALQITFSWRDKRCVAVFRRMRNVRPIEWYQALQTARLLPVRSDGGMPGGTVS